MAAIEMPSPEGANKTKTYGVKLANLRPVAANAPPAAASAPADAVRPNAAPASAAPPLPYYPASAGETEMDADTVVAALERLERDALPPPLPCPPLPQAGRRYSASLTRATATCAPPPGSLRNAAGNAPRTHARVACAALPMAWVVRAAVEAFVASNGANFDVDGNQLVGVARLDRPGQPFHPPHPNLPPEARGMPPQVPPRGTEEDAEVAKLGLYLNKMRKEGDGDGGVSEHPPSALTRFLRNCRGEDREASVRALDDAALEDVFYRLALRYSSAQLCAAVLLVLSELGRRGWTRVSVRLASDGRERTLPIDCFRAHTVEAAAAPEALHYAVASYGPPDFYRTVELLEDTRGGLPTHLVVVNGGVVVDVAAAARGGGLSGGEGSDSRSRGVEAEEWRVYEAGGGVRRRARCRIRPVCEPPSYVAEVAASHEAAVNGTVEGVMLHVW